MAAEDQSQTTERGKSSRATCEEMTSTCQEILQTVDSAPQYRENDGSIDTNTKERGVVTLGFKNKARRIPYLCQELGIALLKTRTDQKSIRG